jgi:hypothetical protein
VLAVGAVAIGQGMGGHNSGVGPSQQPLPPPTPLTAQSFSAATAGWVDGWGQPTDSSAQSAALDGLTCLNDSADNNSPLDQADRTGGAVYVAGETEIGYAIGLEFTDGKSEAAAQAMAASVTQCSPAATAVTTYADGSVVTFYELPGKGASGDFQLWTAWHDDRLGLAVIGGAPDSPSSDTVGRVDDLMMGILQVDGTFTSVPGGAVTSGSATASSSQFGSISDSDFSAALGTWPNDWQRQGTKIVGDALPCAGDWTVGSSSAMSSNLGGNGEQDAYNFDTAENAASSLDALAGDLRACASSPSTITTVPTGNGESLTVAVGNGDSSLITWIVQRGQTVAYVTIPGSVAPPDSVSRAVGGLLVKAIDDGIDRPPPVESSTPVQQQGGNTSSSSSSAAAPQG